MSYTLEFKWARDDVIGAATLQFGEAGNYFVLHPPVHAHTAETLALQVVSPLVAHDTTHAQAADQPSLTHTSPFAGLASNHVHSADHVTLRHEIALTAIHNAVQLHEVDHLVVTHRSPAAAQDTQHAHNAIGELNIRHASPLDTGLNVLQVSDTLTTITHKSILSAADAAHAQAADNFAVTHFSPLAIQAGWHYHRAQRLSFLPDGWVFRALLTVDPVNREVLVGQLNRSAEVQATEPREATVSAEAREATVPEVTREATVPAVGRVSSTGG